MSRRIIMFTKKHYDYVAIAAAIRRVQEDGYVGDDSCYGTIAEICKRLADYFAAENPKFNRARFLKACGVE